MRILQCVTLASRSGSYGGPLTVALRQAEELSRRGHEVKVLAGYIEGDRILKSSPFLSQYRAHRIYGRRFSGLWSPSLLNDFRKLEHHADVVHVHLARDLIPLTAALGCKKPLLVQCHGMIEPDSRKLAWLVDQFSISRIFNKASYILPLQKTEMADLTTAARNIGLSIDDKIELLPNGVQIPQNSVRESHKRDHHNPEVLFLGRLHERKKPLDFVDMARAVHMALPNVRFTLAGPDGGATSDILERINFHRAESYISLEGPIPPEGALDRMRRASVFVLPSEREAFPMALLEALSIGLPSVVTDKTGISQLLADTAGALVAEPTPQALAEKVLLLLKDQKTWESQSVRAVNVVEEHFSMNHVGNKLVSLYQNACTDSPHVTATFSAPRFDTSLNE